MGNNNKKKRKKNGLYCSFVKGRYIRFTKRHYVKDLNGEWKYVHKEKK
jgi:hypothetical protein